MDVAFALTLDVRLTKFGLAWRLCLRIGTELQLQKRLLVIQQQYPTLPHHSSPLQLRSDQIVGSCVDYEDDVRSICAQRSGLTFQPDRYHRS